MTILARQSAGSCLLSHQRVSPSTNRLTKAASLRSQQCKAMPSSSSSSTTTCAQQQAQHSQSAPVQLQQLHNTVSSGPQQQNKQSTPYLQASLLLGAAAVLSTAGAADAAQQLHLVADLDAASAHTLESILRPLFAAFTVLYIIRITMTWYPNIDGTKLPWLLAYGPTEPFLKFTRSVIPLVGGVDITPIVWVALISFFNEILLGPQGILMLIQRESGAGLL